MTAVTVLELLQQKLPANYVIAIIANMEEKVMLDEESSGSILSELEDLFNWSKSKEGYQFWADVFDAIQECRPLPQIPFRTKWFPNTYVCVSDGSLIMNVNDTDEDIYVEMDLSEKPKTLAERFFVEQHYAFVN